MSEKSTEKSIVPLARIQKLHGYPKKNSHGILVSTFKALLFNPGGTLFSGRKNVHLRSPDSSEWQKYSLASEPAPMGGKWGQAKGLLLAFADDADFKSFEVGLPREEFPKLQDEIYLCDLLDAEVVDENGKVFGLIAAFEQTNSNDPSALNILVKSPGETLEIPFAWIDFKGSKLEERKILVPDCHLWKKITE